MLRRPSGESLLKSYGVESQTGQDETKVLLTDTMDEHPHTGHRQISVFHTERISSDIVIPINRDLNRWCP